MYGNAGSTYVRLLVLTALFLGLPALAAPEAIGEIAKVVADDGALGDLFGFSVHMSGDTLVVGAPFDQDQGAETGAAYIFEVDGTSWSQVAKLTTTNSGPGDRSGFDVWVSGNTAFFTTPRDGGNSGAAYLFENDGSGWSEIQKLVPSDPQGNGDFGQFLSLSGDTLLIGSGGKSDLGDRSGAAYVFEDSGSRWAEVVKLLPLDGSAGDQFGSSGSVVGDVAVIGAPSGHAPIDTPGAVYVYNYDGVSWLEQQKIQASDAAIGDRFGIDIDFDGERFIVGACINGIGNCVSAYVFRFDGSQWVEEAKLEPADITLDDTYGSRVAIEDDLAAVTARLDDEVAGDAGAVYTFRFEGTDWVQLAKVGASDGLAGDQFGANVYLEGGTMAVGALFGDGAGADSGAAYLFSGTRLFIAGTCPGEVTIDVTTIDPDKDVILFAGPDQGTSFVPWGKCGGTELDVAFARNWRSVTTDENGEYTLVRVFPSIWCGRYLQGMDRSCKTSNVVRLP
jgi:hypothetical protein